MSDNVVGIIGATVGIGQYIVNDYVITIAETEDEYGYTMTITRGSDTQTVTLYGLTPEQYASMVEYLEQAQAASAAAQTAQDGAEDARDAAQAARNQAITYASNAATSASAAAQSAQDASDYDYQAAQARYAAVAAKEAAVAAQGAAEAAQTAAETAASNAGTSATNAATSATAAASSETNAAGSASAAAQSATNAAASAAAAAQTLTSVQAEGAAQIAAIDAEGQEVLESIPEDYTALEADVTDLKSEIDNCEDELHDILVESGGFVTLTNQQNISNFVQQLSYSYGFSEPVYADGVAKFVSNGSETNPYVQRQYDTSKGSSTWLLGMKIKVSKLTESMLTPTEMAVFMGSGSTGKDIIPVLLDEWVDYSRVVDIDMTRIRYAIYFQSASPSGSFQVEFKNMYLYDVANVDSAMINLIKAQQSENYQDGTVTYGSESNYAPDTTLSQQGKAADAKAVGDALGLPSTVSISFPYNVYINSSGEEVSSSTTISTDYIDLTGIDALSYTGVMGSNRVAHWYDSTKTYLSMSVYANDVFQYDIDIMRTRPSNAAYVRLTAKGNEQHEAIAYYGVKFGDILYASLVGDGVADDTAALQKLVNCYGTVRLNRWQKFRITSSINVNPAYAKLIDGGGATIVVDGNFYAFSVLGTMESTASPNSIAQDVMYFEAGTTIKNFRITSTSGTTGGGIQVSKAFKLNIADNYIFKIANGIRVFDTNRDIMIARNHVYAMQNDGILFDSGVDLHQCNIVGNMISYALNCLHIDSPHAIANFQIGSNDIEISTYPEGYSAARAILFESASTTTQFSEIEMCGNTIQGHGGVQYIVEIDGSTDMPIKDMSISGNHISNSNVATIKLNNVENVAIAANTYKDTGYIYDLDGTCTNVTIVGDAAHGATGKMHAASTAVLNNIRCKNGVYNNTTNSIETSDVTNVDITD